MARTIPVYDRTHSKVLATVDRETARGLVGLGGARYFDRCKAIELLGVDRQFMPPGGKPISSEQGWVYEALGIDKHPQVFQGGLTRTEKKPSPLTVRVQPLRYGRLKKDTQPEVQA